MKIIITTAEGTDDNDWREGYSVLFVPEAGGDNSSTIELVFSDGEPEDANLARDFNDIYRIPELMKAAYEAGTRGENFQVEEKTEED